MLFRQNVDFRLLVPKDNNGTYAHLLMGEPYGRLAAKK